MIETISLIIVCLFCLVLALIAGITTIVKRKEKTAIIPLIITILAISGSVYSGLYFTRKLDKTPTTDEEPAIEQTILEAHVEAAMKDTDEVTDTIKIEADKYAESSFLDSIKTVQPKKKKIPEAYYYSKGFGNHHRMPLIYPYSITIDTDNLAKIEDETKVVNAYFDTDGSKEVIGNISEFLYNQLFLIGKTEDESTTKYFFLKFDTGKLTSFNTEKAIKKYLENMGIGYPDKYFTPKEYYSRF